MKDKWDIEELSGLLFDFAVSCPEGFTNNEAMVALGIKHQSTFDRAARKLRLVLGDSDTINLICDPQGENEHWKYKLVGNVDDARGWASNRIKDLEARLETSFGVSSSLVNATDGRTIEGRKARKITRVLGRLIEDLQELRDDGQMGLLFE